MRIAAALVGAILLVVVPLPGAATHTLFAEGDAQLLALAAFHGWPGSGAPGDPILIEGLTHRVFFNHLTLGLHIRGADLALGTSRTASGIVLLNVSDVTIEDATIAGGGSGIYIHDAARIVVRDSVVTGARNTCITLWGGQQHPQADILLERTTLRGCAKAVDLDHVGPGVIDVRDNTLEDNANGIDATLFATTPILGIYDNRIEGTFGTAILTDAAGGWIGANDIAGGATGIEVRGFRANALVSRNNVTGAGVGIRVSSLDVVVRENFVSENGFGIQVLGANGAEIRSNRLVGNNLGASVGNSFGVIVYDNLFDNDGTNAEEFLSDARWNVAPQAGTNVVGGAIVAGNAWNDALCPDREDDGVCDLPYAPLRPRFREPSVAIGGPVLFDLAPIAFPR